MQAAVRPAGGLFGATFDVSAAGVDAVDPQVAITDAGEAVTIWMRAERTEFPRRACIQAAVLAAGGDRFSTPATPRLSQTPSLRAPAMDGQGNAVAVWSHWNGASYTVEGAIRPGAPGVHDAGRRGGYRRQRDRRLGARRRRLGANVQAPWHGRELQPRRRGQRALHGPTRPARTQRGQAVRRAGSREPQACVVPASPAARWRRVATAARDPTADGLRGMARGVRCRIVR